MKIAIVGFDVEGRSTYEYLAVQGHQLEIRDRNPDTQIPEGVQSVLGDAYLDGLDQFDLVVRTAGLKPSLILDKNPGIEAKITSHVNEFLKATPTPNIIGVTGTKGKGTTSTLITKILEAAGKDVQLGGNIGTPPLSFLNKLSIDSWVVLELSSFQLADIRKSPHIAVCLMVVPEHLDWHPDINDYTTAKSRLFKHQTAEDIAIYFGKNELSQLIAANSPGQKIAYYQPPGAYVDGGVITIDGHPICQTKDLRLLGEHNWQNVCAAVTAAWQATQDVKAIHNVLTSFTGLPHRLELVRELDGVKYYNDSFASGLAATEAATEAIKGKKVMILGGFDRALDLDHFGDFAKQHEADFRTMLLIGESAGRLAKVLDKADYTNYVTDRESKTMPAIVAKVKTLAQSGDSIVLSPGFASFDMFKNFEERGLKFKEAVRQL